MTRVVEAIIEPQWYTATMDFDGATHVVLHIDHPRHGGLDFVLSKDEAQGVADAARQLNDLRVGWQNPPGLSESELAKRTLTNLYNAPPTWLAQAHERLDRAVHTAYGWPYPLDDAEVLARLLEINLARTGSPNVLSRDC